MVVHTCNSNYMGGGDHEELWGQLGQKVSETPISTNKLGVVIHVYNPSFMAGFIGGSWTQARPGEKQVPNLKTNLKSKNG
jgi:hypothetical protein